MKIPFVGPTYMARSLNVAAQRCMNYYPEIDQADRKTVIALYNTPGLILRKALDALGGVRGARVVGNFLYVAAGPKVFKVDVAYNATLLGAIGTANGPVSMDDNGTQLIIVDGPSGYIVTLASGAMAQITDPDFPGADTVAFVDGYFVFNEPGTGRFMITGLYDGGSVDALDFATSEGAPDNLIGVLADHRELWCFNERTTEVYFDSGNTDFPFERIQGAFLEQGCAAKHSPARLANSVFWLGKDERGHGMVWRANGYTPARISTHAIEKAIQGYATIADASGYAYEQEGHGFYVLNFPTGDATWVFDVATELWHERAWRDPANGKTHRHRGACHAHFNGKHLVGDWETAKLYELNLEAYTDNGDPIARVRSAQHISEDERRIRHSALQVQFEAGVGLSSGQGDDPQAALRWSDDGGHTWSNEYWRSIGKQGRYRDRARWRRLGIARDRVYEVTVSDPVKAVMIGASLDGEVLAT